MLTKSGASMIKKAARWMDVFHKLNDANKAKIMSMGLIKPIEKYVNGVNRGTNNILRRYGYTIADINTATPAQLQLAKKRNEEALLDALIRKDKVGAERARSVLKQLKTHEGINPQIKQKADLARMEKTLIDPNDINTHNLYDQHIKNILSSRDGSDAVTNLNKRLIHSGKFNGFGNYSYLNHHDIASQDNGLLQAIINRHEAYEAIAGENQLRKLMRQSNSASQNKILEAYKKRNKNLNIDSQSLKNYDSLTSRALRKLKRTQYRDLKFDNNGSNSQALAMYSSPNIGMSYEINSKHPVGSHLNRNVWTKERKLLDRTPYTNNAGLQTMQKVREDTLETELINTMGGYNPNSLERFNKKNIKNVRIYGNKPVTLSDGQVIKPLF